MPSLNLTPTLSFEPRFRMFISNGYDRKSKRLLSLDFLLYFYHCNTWVKISSSNVFCTRYSPKKYYHLQQLQ